MLRWHTLEDGDLHLLGEWVWYVVCCVVKEHMDCRAQCWVRDKQLQACNET